VRQQPNTVHDVLPRIILCEPSTLETGCWESDYKPRPDGYIRVGLARKAYYLHRVIYEFFLGQVPDGLELDHLCRNRKCCNPWHAEPVTHQVNTKRAIHEKSSRTHCPAGHEYTGENTYRRSNGSRACKACKVQSTREWRAVNVPLKPKSAWTHCKRGHEFTLENTYITARGTRQCKACKRDGRKPN
jgi:hypothetical protein